jgi:hypothetical protein
MINRAKIYEIEYIVHSRYIMDWAVIEPLVFYKDGVPYGLIADVDGLIASTTIDPELPFTKSMLEYLYDLNKRKDITLIADNKKYFSKIKSVLKPRGFTFTMKDGILYSRREKNGSSS